MTFYTKPARRPAAPTIVSLIDILAILLIYVVVTMRVPEKKLLLAIQIPKSSELAGAPALTKRVSLAITPEGEIYLDQKKVPVDSLTSALEKLKSERADIQLEMEADQSIPFGDLVKVWDALAKAGFPMKEVPTRLQRPE